MNIQNNTTTVRAGKTQRRVEGIFVLIFVGGGGGSWLPKFEIHSLLVFVMRIVEYTFVLRYRPDVYPDLYNACILYNNV